MRYTELPPIIRKTSFSNGIAIKSRELLKNCCIGEYIHSRPSILGQTLSCGICNNLMTVTECAVPLYKDVGGVKKMESYTGISSIRYSKPYWSESLIKKDLIARGLDIQSLKREESYTQSIFTKNSIDKFENATIQIYTPAMGITIVLGKVL